MNVGLMLAVVGCKPTDATPPATPKAASAPASQPAAPAPPVAPAPASQPAASAPIVQEQAAAAVGGFAALKESRVSGASCAYEFAPGQALSGAAFEHDGDESWVGLAGKGDVRVKRIPADGSFGGEVEEFELPDGAGHLTVAHTKHEMTLSGSAAGAAGSVTVKLQGGCGD
ncbi:MAG: hypothetical protein H6730_19330 [Deltaproteobacteria bacterium]|nr:hypothetical protein [Deltaproteobacteria bacterium]